MAKVSRDKGLSRSFTVDRSKIDKEKRTVELAFSSEEPVERWGENEVLGHSSGEYDFSRISAGDHPLLLGHAEHDPLSQIGVVESARVDKDKIGRAVVRFSSSERAEEIFKDVQDGIRKLVSVGYDRTGIVRSEKAANGMVTTVYRWQPAHIAIVPVPADTTVGIGRSKKRLCPNCGGDGTCPECKGSGKRDQEGDDDGMEDCEDCGGSGRCGDCRGNGYIKTAKDKPPKEVDLIQSLNAEQIAQNLTVEQKERMKTLLDSAPAAGGGGTAVDEKKLRADVLLSYRERMKEIRAIVDELIKDRPDLTDKLREMAGEAENSDIELKDFRIKALDTVRVNKPAKKISMAGLGYDERDINSYSLVRAIQNCVLRGKAEPDPDTIEGDAHVKMSKRDLGFQPSGFLVPPDAAISRRSLSRYDRAKMQRDLQVQVFAQGGATVATELITPIIEVLRNKMVTERLGVRVMAGLEGNVVIPRQTAPGTAYAVGEIAALTLSNQALDQVPVAPKRVGTTGQYSKQLVLQSSIDVESFMRDDFLKVLAIMWDRLILNGQGAASEPLGIMNTAGVGSVNFGGAASWASIVSFWTAVASANADVGEMAYVTSPSAAGRWQSLAKLLVGATTVAAFPLWEGGGTEGMVNGYRAEATNQMPNNQALFGVFSEVLHCLWGGYDVVVDPFTLAKNAEVVITMNTWGDVALRHPQCFCVSADAANQ